MPVINYTYLNSWEDFISIFDKYDWHSKKYFFRGHSNSSFENSFNEWQLISSFDRSYNQGGTYKFKIFLSQHFDEYLFRAAYGNYKFQSVRDLTECSLLEKCYFFQHYGIPTCFIDFTYDPLIALYFSLSTIPGRSGGTYSIEGDPIFYNCTSDQYYASIIQIDIDQFQKALNITNIDSENFNMLNLNNYITYLSNNNSLHSYLGIDREPLKNLKKDSLNFNLRNQKSCFVYFDNSGCKYSLEIFYKLYRQLNKLDKDITPINIYRISYNSFFAKQRSKKPNELSAFRFLKSKGISGEQLFDDIQGLKYDFNFFHQ